MSKSVSISKYRRVKSRGICRTAQVASSLVLVEADELRLRHLGEPCSAHARSSVPLHGLQSRWLLVGPAGEFACLNL
jgi:hypothetical protein